MSIRDLITSAIDADVPVLLWGPPGAGKTATIEAMAEDRGVHLETLIGSTVDPVDVGGYLVPDAEGRVRVSPPPWAARLAERGGWLFLDELSCAPPSVQAALLRVVQSRQVAGLDLRRVRIIAAANPSDTAADGGWLSAASANRWAHIDYAPDVGVWTSGTVSGWSHGWTESERTHAARVAAYVSANASALLSVPTGEAAGRAWPSPRSWTAGIRMLARVGSAGLESCIGGPAAREYAEWVAKQDLPDAESVLAGSAKLPKRGDQIAATLLAVVGAALADRADRAERIARARAILATQRPDLRLRPERVLLDATGEVPETTEELGRRVRGVTQ